MKLWLLTRTDDVDYDQYDSAVVCAEDEIQARNAHPGSVPNKGFGTWTSDDKVQCEFIGEAKEGLTEGVVCGSFNDG